jgi:small subunit ribosomal protein S35
LLYKWFGISELKKRIERFYAGDAEAVPSIFEAILKRKLAGKHDEADKKVIEEICGKRAEPLDDSDDEDFDSDSDEEFGSKFDGSADDEDFDESFHAKKNVMKKNARDE